MHVDAFLDEQQRLFDDAMQRRIARHGGDTAAAEVEYADDLVDWLEGHLRHHNDAHDDEVYNRQIIEHDLRIARQIAHDRRQRMSASEANVDHSAPAIRIRDEGGGT